VIRYGFFLCGLVTPALLRYHMQNNRTLVGADGFKGFYKLVYVMSVNRTIIGEPHFFKKHARKKHYARAARHFYYAVAHILEFLFKEIFHALFYFHNTVFGEQFCEKRAQRAHAVRNEHLVVVDQH